MGSVCMRSIVPADQGHMRHARSSCLGGFRQWRLSCKVLSVFDVCDTEGCVCDSLFGDKVADMKFPEIVFLEQHKWQSPAYYLVYQRLAQGELLNNHRFLELVNRYLADIQVLHRIRPLHQMGCYVCEGWTANPLMLAAVAEVRFSRWLFGISR